MLIVLIFLGINTTPAYGFKKIVVAKNDAQQNNYFEQYQFI